MAQSMPLSVTNMPYRFKPLKMSCSNQDSLTPFPQLLFLFAKHCARSE